MIIVTLFEGNCVHMWHICHTIIIIIKNIAPFPTIYHIYHIYKQYIRKQIIVLLSHRLRMREQSNMDAFEELLCDEVRRYPHLYNPSLQYYKDAQMTTTSWGEIARTLGKEEKVCRAKWKYLRDRFVKIKKNAPRHLSNS